MLTKLAYILLPHKKFFFRVNYYKIKNANTILTKLLHAKRNKFSEDKIKKIFLSFGINFKTNNQNFYTVLLNYLFDTSDKKKNKSFLVNHLISLSSHSMKFHSWLRLRDLFYIKSKMTLGGICRKKSICSILEAKTWPLLHNKNKSRARLDKILNTENIVEHLKKNPLEYNFNKKLINYYLSLLYQNQNQDFSINILKHRAFANNEREYFETLKNKTLAIVGPCYNEHNSGLEIDSYDLILRFNHISTNILDEKKMGSRTDITFLNGNISENLFSKKIKLSRNVKFVIFKYKKPNQAYKFQYENPNLIVKMAKNYNNFLFNSSFNVLPMVLLDLLETNLKKIKIFNSDLFLSDRDKHYCSNFYQKGEEIKKQQLISFLDHDPMQHHEFLKKIYNNKKIFGDKIFDKIMKLDSYEYLEKLENCY